MSQFNPTTNEIYHASVNACIAPLVSVDGKHIITVEGIGNVNNPHPAQERIAMGSGSQCGFCTPGIVMVRKTYLPTEVRYLNTHRVYTPCYGIITSLLKPRLRRHLTAICVDVQAIDPFLMLRSLLVSVNRVVDQKRILPTDVV